MPRTPAALRQIKLDAVVWCDVKAIHMNWHKPGSRRGYHHGNLREALIEAALDLIGSKGPGGFTFAEAARHAGVSPAAPYRHYENREALMAEVAAKGFAAFTQALEKARNGGKPDPLTALKNCGKAYLEFARTQPAYYSAMFEGGLDISGYPELRKAADEAFASLKSAVGDLIETLPQTGRPPVLMVALHIWSVSHGIASLFGRGDGAAFKQPISPEELLEAHTLIYLQGLGIRA
jgi:AcrR family transcriptional regulator